MSTHLGDERDAVRGLLNLAAISLPLLEIIRVVGGNLENLTHHRDTHRVWLKEQA